MRLGRAKNKWGLTYHPLEPIQHQTLNRFPRLPMLTVHWNIVPSYSLESRFIYKVSTTAPKPSFQEINIKPLTQKLVFQMPLWGKPFNFGLQGAQEYLHLLVQD